MEDYKFLVGTTHFDGEDELLYVAKKVYVDNSLVIFVRRAPIMKNGIANIWYDKNDETPVCIEGVVGGFITDMRWRSAGG